MKTAVPIFMYHTVGVKQKDWLWNHLTIDYKLFDQQMSVLKKMGCHSISLEELYQYMDKGVSIPENAFVLTFDDGYLDCWVAVYPILKKYGFKGTVYVNTDFIDPAEELRPNLEDVWNNNEALGDLTWPGFLSWKEIFALDKSGVVDVQSHAITHTWYFNGPKLVDFVHPGDEYVWMNWNRFPDQKYNYMSEDPELKKEYGAPVYEHEKSLETRRYFPDSNIHSAITEYVSEERGGEFFSNKDWKNILLRKYSELSEKCSNNKFETDEEYYDRLKSELNDSKEVLEKKLNKKIDFLCWPGGGHNDDSVKIASSIYKSFTLGSKIRTNKKNTFGDDPQTIKRIGIPYISFREDHDDICYLGGFYMYLMIKSFQGSKVHNTVRKFVKLYYLIFNKLRNSLGR